MYCYNCGKSVSSDARFCRNCGVELALGVVSKQTRKTGKNRYDESVKEWFTSRTFRTILFIGLFFGCCYFLFSISLVGSALDFINKTLSLEKQVPYIVRDDGRNALELEVETAINLWLAKSPPIDAPYYFVTYWQRENDGRYLVSLAAVRLSSPEEKWTLVDDVNPDNNKVAWIGTVEVNGWDVRLYP